MKVLERERITVYSDGSGDYLKDINLSFKDKGVMALLMKIAPTSKRFFSSEVVAEFAKDQSTSINSGLRSLRSAGYLERKQVFIPGSRGVSHYRWSAWESLSLKSEVES